MPRFIMFLLSAGLALSAAGPAAADPPMNLGGENTDTGPIPVDKPIGFAEGSFVFAPVPFSSPAIGTGLGLGASWMFQTDAGSDPSHIAIGGFKSDNDSYGGIIGAKLITRDGRVTLHAVGGYFNLNYDLYVAGSPVALTQEMDGIRLDGGYGITDTLSLGGIYKFRNTSTRPDSDEALLPDELLDQRGLKINEVGAYGEWDTRDDIFKPGKGGFSNVTVTRSSTSGNKDVDYWVGSASLAGYREAFGGVLAGNIVACASGEEAPYFDACGIGTVDRFRGYPPGQYYDDRLLSAQGEYRRQLNQRFGMVLFGGLGGVGEDVEEVFTDNGLAAIGGGLRVRLSKEYNLDYSVDATLNDEGDTAWYVFVGQRF